jgi:hypothetical protein
LGKAVVPTLISRRRNASGNILYVCLRIT